MNTIEKKNDLKRRIDSTDNENLLQKIEELLDKEEIYILTEAQLNAVSESIEQYNNGEFLSEEEANNDIEKWFEKQKKSGGQ